MWGILIGKHGTLNLSMNYYLLKSDKNRPLVSPAQQPSREFDMSVVKVLKQNMWNCSLECALRKSLPHGPPYKLHNRVVSLILRITQCRGFLAVGFDLNKLQLLNFQFSISAIHFSYQQVLSIIKKTKKNLLCIKPISSFFQKIVHTPPSILCACVFSPDLPPRFHFYCEYTTLS